MRGKDRKVSAGGTSYWYKARNTIYNEPYLVYIEILGPMVYCIRFLLGPAQGAGLTQGFYHFPLAQGQECIYY